MKKENLTSALEDYLKIIYKVTESSQRASTSQIAEALGVRPASVTGMIQKMASSQPPLVKYQKHQGVLLTDEGERAALQILRNHRMLERFLYEIMGFPWDEVHAEADRLEHVISEAFVKRMEVLLGNPTHDPHGEPIPTRDLNIPEDSSFPLTQLVIGQAARVKRVSDSNAALLRHLLQIGIVPGAILTIMEIDPFDDNRTIKVQGLPETTVIGSNIARVIFVDIEA